MQNIEANIVKAGMVETKMLIVNDEKGKARAVLNAGEAEDSVVLRLNDATEKTRATLGLSNSGEASLTFLDAQGKASITLLLSNDSKGLVCVGPNGAPQMMIGVPTSGEPQVTFIHPSGQGVLTIPMAPPDGTAPSGEKTPRRR